MAVTKVLARDWTLEIDQDPFADTPTGSPDYVEVNGLTTLTFDGEKNDADTTTFDSGGYLEHIVSSRGKSLTAEGYYLEDADTGDRDPGQEAVETVAELTGADSLGDFKLTSPSGTVKEFSASAVVTGVGGGNDDPAGWGAELTVSGQITTT